MFCCITLRPPKPWHFMLCSWDWKLLLTWFEIIWTYNAEAIDYWTIFSMKVKSNRNKKNIRIWRCSLCCWKALGALNLIEYILQFSKLKCGRFYFLSEFYCWKFKQITKIRFEKKNQLNPQCVHTWKLGQ